MIKQSDKYYQKINTEINNAICEAMKDLKWHDVKVIMGFESLPRIYVDSKLVYTAKPLVMFDGTISETRIFNKQLSKRDIKRIFRAEDKKKTKRSERN